MRLKTTIIATLLSLAVASAALADTNTVTWTNPTQFTDDTTLSPSDITSSTVEWGTCSGTSFGTTSGTGTATGAVTSFITPDLAAGTWCHRVRTNMKSGTQSLWSNVAIKTISPKVPKPPVLVTVTTTAYELRGVWTKRMVAVGTVGLGTACGNQWRKDNSYARVTRADVTITTRYKGGRLYGTCDSAS